jgi:hypothetical protein
MHVASNPTPPLAPVMRYDELLFYVFEYCVFVYGFANYKAIAHQKKKNCIDRLFQNQLVSRLFGWRPIRTKVASAPCKWIPLQKHH